MSDLVPQWMIDIKTEKMRRMGRDAYIADAFKRMREMAKKQDDRNAKLKGNPADARRQEIRDTLERMAPGYTPNDKDTR